MHPTNLQTRTVTGSEVREEFCLFPCGVQGHALGDSDNNQPQRSRDYPPVTVTSCAFVPGVALYICPSPA